MLAHLSGFSAERSRPISSDFGGVRMTSDIRASTTTTTVNVGKQNAHQPKDSERDWTESTFYFSTEVQR